MKLLWACVLICSVAFAQSQPEPKPAPPTLASLGLSYALSPDWILATTLMRNQAEADNRTGNSVVMAAVYVPQNKKLSLSSPFFSLLALHHPHPDCGQFLDAMRAQLEKQEKTKIKNAKQAFSAAGREFYRTDFEQKVVLGHRALICTTSNDYVVVWNAGAKDENGLEAVVSTLDSVKPIVTMQPPQSPSDGGDPQSDSASPETSTEPRTSQVERVRVSSGVSTGLLVKKVPPVYPTEARAAYIQGTVILRAEISKEGDIAKLELMSGPIELVGSAVDAVRQWKYRPYLFNGEPVAVDTQIQVNYVLAAR